MITKVFALRDSKVDAYMPPVFLRTSAEALRLLGDLTTDSSSPVGKHPEDFALFELGEFDDSTGKITQLAQPHCLGLAVEHIPDARAAALSFA